MFKILFADDEPYVIEGLKIMVDWQELGIEIVGEASDGETALELIKKLSPDIVISDICMPCISGTELLKKSANFRVKPEFIMLTGYGKMEYIKTAMKYGAKGYLLKPLDPEEITKTIRNVCEELSKQRENRKGMDEMLNVVVGDTFRKIFFCDTSNETFDKGRFVLGLKEDAPVMLIGFQLAQGNKLSNESECFKKIFREVPAEGACVFTLGYRHIFVVNTNVSYIANNVIAESAIEECTGISMIKVDGIRELQGAYFEIMRSFMKIEEGVTIVRFIKNEVISTIDTGVEEVIKNAVNGNAEFARRKLREDIEGIKNSKANLDYMRGYAVSMVMQMERYAVTSEIKAENVFDGTLAAFSNAYDYEVMGALCEELLDIFIETMANTKLFDTMVFGDELVEYIKRNYAGNITLVQMSKDLGVSTGLISKIIKNKTGMKFSDYLNFVRIQNAKKLLKHSNKKITRIASESGYNDYHYFASKFKEHTGKLPSDYRKKRRTWQEKSEQK